MLDLFGVPAQMLPEVVPSAGRIAVTDAWVWGGRAPIGAIVGDQQAALFGHRCEREGMTKLTLGTGAFLWCNAGARPPEAAPLGVVSTCAWQIGETITYALEGFVPNSGSVTIWLRRLGALGARAWPVVRPGALPRGASTAAWCVAAAVGPRAPGWAPLAAAGIGRLM